MPKAYKPPFTQEQIAQQQAEFSKNYVGVNPPNIFSQGIVVLGSVRSSTASFNTVYTVPIGKIAFITGFSWGFSKIAGSTGTDAYVALDVPSAYQYFDSQYVPSAPDKIFLGQHFTLPIRVIAGRSIVVGKSVVEANSFLSCSVFGYEIPKYD